MVEQLSLVMVVLQFLHLNTLTTPIMKANPGYIRNSQDLVVLLESKTLPSSCTFVAADVENMYPSIDIQDGLKLLRRAINRFNEKTSQPINNIEFLLELTEWVLTNNYFEFGTNTFWLQIKGTAMGTPVAITFACIYMSELEFEM